MPHCHCLGFSRELRTQLGQGWSLCFWWLNSSWCHLLLNPDDKQCGVSSLCWMLTGKRAVSSSMGTSQSSFLPQTGQEQDLARGKDIWNYFLEALMPLLCMSWKNRLGKCCSILIAALTLGQLGAPDALISRPYQNFSVKSTFLIENVLSKKRKQYLAWRVFSLCH